MELLEDVFGINSKKIVLSYYERDGIDDNFNNYIRKKNKHIIIHGGSKQGKTTLVKKYLGDNAIKINCDSTIKTKDDLYAKILARMNASISVSELVVEKEVSLRKGDIETGTVLGSIMKSSFGGEESSEKQVDVSKFNYTNIVDTLKNFYINRKLAYIIIDDFHYLSTEIQRELSTDLKGLYEEGVYFIIIGVWSEQNRLANYNDDLDGRFEEIDMAEWKKTDLIQIIHKGEKILNIKLMDSIATYIADESLGNVGILQETMVKLCESKKITEKQETLVKIDVKKEEICKIFNDLSNFSTFVNKLKEILRGSKTGTLTYVLVMIYIVSIIQYQDKKIFNVFDIVTTLKKKFAGQPRVSSNLHTSVPQICNGLNEKYSDIFSYSDQKLYINNIYFLFRLKWNTSILLEQLRKGDYEKVDIT